mmetsp:Transcript_67956/g.162267  ORF Transcript_67956/g.162267 Transcript_67956/m.162267 type:complete len:255 (-) Transcript_67956:328-1092(-)
MCRSWSSFSWTAASAATSAELFSATCTPRSDAIRIALFPRAVLIASAVARILAISAMAPSSSRALARPARASAALLFCWLSKSSEWKIEALESFSETSSPFVRSRIDSTSSRRWSACSTKYEAFSVAVAISPPIIRCSFLLWDSSRSAASRSRVSALAASEYWLRMSVICVEYFPLSVSSSFPTWRDAPISRSTSPLISSERRLRTCFETRMRSSDSRSILICLSSCSSDPYPPDHMRWASCTVLTASMRRCCP